MKLSKAKQLDDLFEQMDSEFPDKSTEFLIQMTADRAHMSDIYKNCAYGDVVDALAMCWKRTNKKEK